MNTGNIILKNADILTMNDGPVLKLSLIHI